MPTYDAVVVGARCAGSVVAGQLAREGWKVLLVDKAVFPSDTVSTHFMFPNTLARLEAIGVLDRLYAGHDIPELGLRWNILGHELAGPWTPVGSHSLGVSVTRLTLDATLVEWAQDAGAEARFDTRVEGLIGIGSDDEPVRGVILEDGERIEADWVLGADGRASTVASLLNLEKEHPLAGDQSFLFAYWRGLPARDCGSLDVIPNSALMWNPCEDGIHLVSVGGPPEMTRGSNLEREKAYARGLEEFPATLDRATIDKAERISDLVVVPETMMRGFFRRASGPGWALLGDAGHFKHPATAQGISDAIEQAIYVADGLAGADADLAGYEAWRRQRSKGHYEWSFLYGTWPRSELVDLYLGGLASDPAALQDWRDVFTRLKRPSDVDTPERLGRWLAPLPT